MCINLLLRVDGGLIEREARGTYSYFSLVPGALDFGLIIMAMVYATGHLSGAHLNPAVTVAFVVTRHFPRTEALAYLAAQLAGALVVAGLLAAVWPSNPAALERPFPRPASAAPSHTRRC